MVKLAVVLVLAGCGSGKVTDSASTDSASTDSGPGDSDTGDSGGETVVDADGDGFPEAVDCEDEVADIHPGATDIPDDGIDQDCSGEDSTAETAWTDADSDGYPDTVDCDDEDATIYPGAEEVALDGIDQDCDGADSSTEDADGDGYPDTVDCDDGDPEVHPTASETWYDGVDQDCDGNDDDQDGDGASYADDCDDTDASVAPGADETLDDSIDQDCDGYDTQSLAALGTGDLILTEIMNKPAAVADAYGEWIEIYNNSGAPVELLGLVVTATDTALVFTVDESVLVGVGGYAVLARDGDTAVDGDIPWDFDYRSDFSLDNDAETLTLSYAATTFDSVAYDDASFFPDEAGYAMSLDSGHISSSSNDQGQYWCDATDTYGDGDHGTPGAANDACSGMTDADGDDWVSAHDCDDSDADIFPGASETARDGTDSDCDDADGYASSLRSGDLILDEILQNPDAVDEGDGEWFEVYVNNSYSWNLRGLTVKDESGTELFTVDEDVIVTSHQYVVFAVNGDETANGGVATVDYDYPGSTFGLGNGSDGIYLYPSDSSTTVVDSVAWDNGDSFPDPSGASMSLKSSAFSVSGNNSGSAWCTSTSHIADSVTNDLGTPGERNDSC